MDTPLANPFDQFTDWYDKAAKADIDKPNAMVLSTSDTDGQAFARVVLLSSYNENGFVFHTNYKSEKGKQIDANNKVSLLFWWDELGYQVRINGHAEKTLADDSDKYFSRRPHGSKIGAWASEQSSAISDRSVLDKNIEKYSEQFAENEVPRPPHWGGYRVIPDEFEFWVNRDDRLHDRFLFRKSNHAWEWSRLAP